MKTQVLRVEIGGVVDFIDKNTRARGIVLCISKGLACLGVVGSRTVYVKPVDDCVPVRDSTAVIAALRNPQ